MYIARKREGQRAKKEKPQQNEVEMLLCRAGCCSCSVRVLGHYYCPDVVAGAVQFTLLNYVQHLRLHYPRAAYRLDPQVTFGPPSPSPSPFFFFFFARPVHSSRVFRWRRIKLIIIRIKSRPLG